ncbi:serine/threonine protein kinase [Bailinhaonella thermotolerans]|uniref:Serine/threonine protein kinase n=2 Tax=Bailinhaonella thermotolerans TaxID=1070861 RepID=A0A3A4AAU3_9ACTN|nr:serine/threonine protein kinase [Bailinhaonella thermotolerans]
MGVVHLAVDPEGREVAVKVLHPHVAGNEQARRRLAREVETMRRIRSPHVAEVIDADVTARSPYIVTRYVHGRSLDQTVMEDGPLRGDELVRLIRGLSAALVAIHEAGVIHRDLKPGNVMIVHGEALVIDFGIAHLVDGTRLTQTGMFVGTPGYLAPEVLQDSEITQAADIHSFGSTVYYAATGKGPFGSGSFEAICFNVMEGRADLSAAPGWLRPFLAETLDVEARRRPTARAVRAKAQELVPGVSPARDDGHGHTKVFSREDTFSDLLPPVNYAEPPPRPPRRESRQARNQEAPPAVVAPPPVPDARAAAYPPPDRRAQPAYDRQVAGPREYRALHPLHAALLLAIVVGLAAMLPVLTCAFLLVIVVGLRVGDRLYRGVEQRRSVRGGNGNDAMLAVLGTPMALARAVLATALSGILSFAFGLCVWGGLKWLAGLGTDRAAAYGAAAFAAGLFVLPGGAAPRRAVMRTLTAVIPSRQVMMVSGLVLGVLAFFLVAMALGASPTWTPWRPPSKVISELVSEGRDTTWEFITGLVNDFIGRIGIRI